MTINVIDLYENGGYNSLTVLHNSHENNIKMQ
jgi:hypothetical protein